MLDNKHRLKLNTITKLWCTTIITCKGKQCTPLNCVDCSQFSLFLSSKPFPSALALVVRWESGSCYQHQTRLSCGLGKCISNAMKQVMVRCSGCMTFSRIGLKRMALNITGSLSLGRHSILDVKYSSVYHMHSSSLTRVASHCDNSSSCYSFNNAHRVRRDPTANCPPAHSKSPCHCFRVLKKSYRKRPQLAEWHIKPVVVQGIMILTCVMVFRLHS